jgi:hypothetical protein
MARNRDRELLSAVACVWAVLILSCTPTTVGTSVPTGGVSDEALQWCMDKGPSGPNAVIVAWEMDREHIPEPSPGWLVARLRASGWQGSETVSWSLAAIADPAIISEFSKLDSTSYAAACTEAYKRRTSPQPFPSNTRPSTTAEPT